MTYQIPGLILIGLVFIGVIAMAVAGGYTPKDKGDKK